MKSIRLLYGIVALVTCVEISNAQDKYFLDLTRKADTEKVAENGFGCGPRLTGSDHSQVAPLIAGIKIDLVSLDNTRYAVGDPVVCQVRLTNSGKKPFRIPWNPNPEYANKNCTGESVNGTDSSLEASIALVFTSESGEKRRVPLAILYGRASVPETIRLLNPGEAASVKVRSILIFSNTASARGPARNFDVSRDFLVVATYNLDDSLMVNPYEEADSANQIDVRVDVAEPKAK